MTSPKVIKGRTLAAKGGKPPSRFRMREYNSCATELRQFSEASAQAAIEPPYCGNCQQAAGVGGIRTQRCAARAAYYGVRLHCHALSLGELTKTRPSAVTIHLP